MALFRTEHTYWPLPRYALHVCNVLRMWLRYVLCRLELRLQGPNTEHKVHMYKYPWTLQALRTPYRDQPSKSNQLRGWGGHVDRCPNKCSSLAITHDEYRDSHQSLWNSLSSIWIGELWDKHHFPIEIICNATRVECDIGLICIIFTN